MNAERLHTIVLALRSEMHEKSRMDRMRSLVNALQNLVNSPNQNTQNTLATERNAFFAAFTDTPSDSFSPAWRQVLVEIGGESIFGHTLKQSVEDILTANQMTPAAALTQLQLILQEMEAFLAALDHVIAGFKKFRVGTEQLAPGEAEIGVLIPRAAVKDELVGFTAELQEIEFILDSLSQVAGGRKEDLRIKTLSSSELMVYVLASSWVAACVAKSVDLVVGQYLKLLQVRKLQLEIQRLEVPEEISEKMKAHANNLMAEGIEKFTVQIVNEFHVGNDGERKNELTNAVNISLSKMANRIDKGFNIEVRIQPDGNAAAGDPAQKEKDEKAQGIVKAAAENMQYLKLEGPPILALPEKAEASQERPKHKASSKKEKD